MKAGHSVLVTSSRTRIVRVAGFSLIELLVSMVIGLVVTLAITSVLIRSEGSKRSSTSVNDINQTGAFTAFVLDRAIKNAGSGFSQSWSTTYGCRLDVKQSGTAVLPFPSAIPSTSTFVGVTTAAMPIRLAPVVIGKGLAPGTGGDVLMVMGGNGGASETGAPSTITAGSPGTVAMVSTVGYKTAGGDMLLLADPGVTTGCMVQQTASATSTVLTLGGAYASTGTNVTLSNFAAGSATIALQLGQTTTNPPEFQLFGVGANNTLSSVDLLKPYTADVPIADGVVEMRALYGVSDTAPYNTLDSWIDPTGATWGASVMLNGSAASQVLLRRVVAVRLGFILRTSLQERAADYVYPSTTIKLFTDLPTALQQTRTLTTADRAYRYRTVEITVPLRNVLMAPQS